VWKKKLLGKIKTPKRGVKNPPRGEKKNPCVLGWPPKCKPGGEKRKVPENPSHQQKAHKVMKGMNVKKGNAP